MPSEKGSPKFIHCVVDTKALELLFQSLNTQSDLIELVLLKADFSYEVFFQNPNLKSLNFDFFLEVNSE